MTKKLDKTLRLLHGVGISGTKYVHAFTVIRISMQQ
jgi:hypothetical protein